MAKANLHSLRSLVAVTPLRARLLIACICLLCYGNTVFNDYSLDDDLITENPNIQKGMRGIPDIFTSPYYTKAEKSIDYRPLSSVTFAVEKQFFGDNPHVSHIVNIILYVLLTLLVFHVLCELFHWGALHPLLPLVIALFFAVHPAHTEVVASIKNRDEIMSMILVFLALLFAHRYFASSAPLQGGLSILFFMLSLLAKMTSLPVLAIFVLLGIFRGMHRKKEFYLFVALLLIFCGAYVGGVLSGLKRPMYDLENPLFHNSSISLRVGTIGETLLFYLKFLLAPFPFRFYYGYNMIPLIPVTHPIALFSLAIHSGLLVAGLILFRKKNLLGFFILSYLCGILFYSNILLYPSIVGERVLLIPSLWFIAMCAVALVRGSKLDEPNSSFGWKQKMTIGAVGIIFCIYAVLTINRNFQWKNRLTLFQSDIRHLENSALANYFYALELKKQAGTGLVKTAEQQRFLALSKKHLKRTLEIAPRYRTAFYHLGMIYEYEEQNRDSAFHYFSEGYRIDTNYNPLKFQFAKQLYLRGQYLGAEFLLRQLFNDIPDDVFTLYFYAKVLFELGKHEQAFRVNENMRALVPQYFYAYLNAGNFYRALGETRKAIENYEKAISFGFKDDDVQQYILSYYQGSGNARNGMNQ